MQATRYRLRYVSGVSFTAATYGSSTFGGPITYGQRASDVLDSFFYRVVPLPAGWPTQPGWIRRHGDITPIMQAQILSETSPLDLTAWVHGYYVLRPIHRPDDAPTQLRLQVDDNVNGIVSHTWDSTTSQLPAGVYRVVVSVEMSSGRRLTAPGDDNLRLSVVPQEALSA